MVIEFEGKEYAKNNSEFVETLFSKTKTAFGFYKPAGKCPMIDGILLMDHQRKPIKTVYFAWKGEM